MLTPCLPSLRKGLGLAFLSLRKGPDATPLFERHVLAFLPPREGLGLVFPSLREELGLAFPSLRTSMSLLSPLLVEG